MVFYARKVFWSIDMPTCVKCYAEFSNPQDLVDSLASYPVGHSLITICAACGEAMGAIKIGQNDYAIAKIPYAYFHEYYTDEERKGIRELQEKVWRENNQWG